MTHITWIITSLLLSLFVGLTVSCSKLANGNRMKKMGDVRGDEDLGKRSVRTLGQRLSIAEFTRRARNRRNVGSDYDSISSFSSVEENAIYPEPPESGFVHDGVQTPHDLEKIFYEMDADGDGVVSLEEFRQSPAYPGDEPFTMRFDRNGDGLVTLEEYLVELDVYESKPSYPIEVPNESICSSSPKYKGERCEDCIMAVCDFQFINATQCVGEDFLSPDAICNSFQVYIDCIARESFGCEAKNFTNKILSIASGLKGDGECPDLHLAALRRPDHVLPRKNVYAPGGTGPELQELPRINQEPLWPHGIDDPLFPTYGSGNKQGEFDLGGFQIPLEFLTDLDTAFPGGDLDTESSSSSSSYTDIEDSKSLNKHRGVNPVRTSNTEETTTVKELLQLQNDERDSLSRDNAQQSATPSWEAGTRRTRTHHRHRHHHTSHLQTQSTEQIRPLHIRQVRSSTTKRRPIEKSSRSRSSNCKVSTIWPCNQAFISALAQGDVDPCESLVRFRHCVHKSTRHCTDTNVYKINEGLKYLSKEHRRAKLCGQIRITL